jgi:diguanylate cyclase (GGDEF)-like protein
MFTPDTDTLRLSSILLTIAFTAVFLMLWLGRRRDRFLLHWAASAALYAVVLAAFEASAQDPPPGFGGVLYATLAGSNALLLSGARRFDGKAPFPPWLWLPLLLAFLGYAAPFWLAAAGQELRLPESGRIGGFLGLLASVGSVGLLLLRGQHGKRGRRIAGLAVLAYIPGYVVILLLQSLEHTQFHHIALLPMLSDQVLLAILYLGLLSMPGERAEAELREAVQRDPLTGAWNRAGMAALEPQLLADGGALIVSDIDHFKAINDRHGHAAGDAVLSSFAAHMAALALEQGGRLVRLGGDEFVVLMAGATMDAAERLARRMHGVVLAGIEGLPPYTISLGVAMLRTEDTSLAVAIARTDERLYRAKSLGRNRMAS